MINENKQWFTDDELISTYVTILKYLLSLDMEPWKAREMARGCMEEMHA